MSGQCGYCGGWHTSPGSCPAVPNNAGASQPLGDWRDVEIERLRRELAEANLVIANYRLAGRPEYARAEEQLAEAQLDAERYRWLRGQAERGLLVATVDIGMYDYFFNAEKINAAIDADMKGER